MSQNKILIENLSMTLLDDLKKKAKEAKDTSSDEADITDRKQALFGPIIQRRLIFVQRFFTELSDTLNELQPEERYEFKLTNTVTLKAFQQRNFSCYIEKTESQQLKEVIFKYELLGQSDHNVTCYNAPERDLLKKVLTERNIRFQTKTNNQNQTLYSIKPKVNCRFCFLPDYDDGLIILKIINYDGTWDQTLKFRPDKINDELLDEVGKYALHKENQLMEMTGNRLSITMRERLQQKLHRPKKKKKIIKKKRVSQEKKKSPGIMGFLKR